jgi:hypothetical protein
MNWIEELTKEIKGEQIPDDAITVKNLESRGIAETTARVSLMAKVKNGTFQTVKRGGVRYFWPTKID